MSKTSLLTQNIWLVLTWNSLLLYVRKLTEAGSWKWALNENCYWIISLSHVEKCGMDLSRLFQKRKKQWSWIFFFKFCVHSPLFWSVCGPCSGDRDMAVSTLQYTLCSKPTSFPRWCTLVPFGQSYWPLFTLNKTPGQSGSSYQLVVSQTINVGRILLVSNFKRGTFLCRQLPVMKSSQNPISD